MRHLIRDEMVSRSAQRRSHHAGDAIYIYPSIYINEYIPTSCVRHLIRDEMVSRAAQRRSHHAGDAIYVYVYISISMYIYIFIYPPLVCGISSGTRWYRVPPSDDRTTREIIYIYICICICIYIYIYVYIHIYIPTSCVRHLIRDEMVSRSAERGAHHAGDA